MLCGASAVPGHNDISDMRAESPRWRLFDK